MKNFLFILWAYSRILVADHVVPIIAHTHTPPKLQYEVLYKIFTLQQPKWKHNSYPVTVVIISLDQPIHAMFVNKYLGIAYPTYMRIMRGKFGGGRTGKPPIIVNTYQELVDKIHEIYGSIGYIDESIIPELENINSEIIFVEVQ